MEQKKSSINKSLLTKIIIAVIVVAIVGALLYVASMESRVNITDNKLEIKGMYGKTWELENIESIELVENNPTMTKVNGAAFSKVKKGIFNVKELGTSDVYIHAKGKTIVIMTTDRPIIINFRSEEKTVDLYNQLTEAA